MVTMTVTLSEDRLQKLQDLAAQFRITPEELLRVSVEELIARPQADFQKAIDYVLKKNKELYKRLARFCEHLGRIGKSLGQSVDAYNSAVGSLERQVLPGARKFTELGLRPRRDIEELSTVDKLTRSPREDDGEEEPARNDQ